MVDLHLSAIKRFNERAEEIASAVVKELAKSISGILLGSLDLSQDLISHLLR
jgi:hypothetical protein